MLIDEPPPPPPRITEEVEVFTQTRTQINKMYVKIVHNPSIWRQFIVLIQMGGDDGDFLK